MKIYKLSQIEIEPSKVKSWPTSYAPIGGFPKMTRQTNFDVNFRMSVDEFLKLDEYYDTGKHEKTAREIIIRIIRTYPELIRAHTEGKI